MILFNNILILHKIVCILCSMGCFLNNNSIFYYRSRNDKEVDFVLREGTRILRLVQVCYDMSSPKTEKREVYRI
ncbi:MAG: hypothetical protein SOR57_12205 [Parabacteroides sp.]|nr:hypothetical protein [Parabacteroides sp.]